MKKKDFQNLNNPIVKLIPKNNLSPVNVFDLLGKKKLYNLYKIREFWQEHILRIKKGELKDNISFYLHIPFCQSKCEYCRHFYWQGNNQSQLDDYLSSLIFKMNFFKDVFSGIKFKTLYIGGGTPSLLKEKQIKKLFKTLYQNFEFEEEGEKTFECNPINTTFQKLKILEKYGINRISFGVQTTNEKILRTMNRGYQNFNLVKKVINEAKKCKKFRRINVDLIIGLKGDSIKTVINSFGQIAVLKPDSIALYPLQPTEEYLKNYYQGRKNLFDKELKRKIEDFLKLIKTVASKYNYLYFFSKSLFPETDSYNFISWDFILRKDRTNIYQYSYDDTKPIDCFGLGSGSSSYIFENLEYQEIAEENNWKNFYKNIYSGITFDNLKEKKLYYILGRLADDKLNPISYEKLFSSNLLEDFQEPIIKLKKLNKIKIKRNLISLSSQSPQQRFIDSLFFLEKNQITDDLTN